MTWYPAKHKTFYIYALLDDEGLVVYVGATVNPKQRRRVHMITAGQAYRGDTPLKRWLLERKLRGVGVDMLLLEKVQGIERTRLREVATIDTYLRMGCKLLNTSSMPKQALLW